MKKIARALGILLLVAFSFSCSNLFDEKKYNSSTLEKDSGKGSGDSGGSGGNGGSGGSGGNGGSGGDTYVKPETYLNDITDTRFYEVYTAEAKLDSYTVGERLQLSANLMTDKGFNVQDQLDAKVTKVNYVTIEPRNYTIPLNILFATNDSKEIPLYSATLHNIAEGTTVKLGTQFIIIGVSEYGVLAINCRDGIVENATEFMTFFCTKKGIEHYFAGKKNGWYTFYIEDVNFKYKYPTEEEIKLEVKKITQPDGGDNGSSASETKTITVVQPKGAIIDCEKKAKSGDSVLVYITVGKNKFKSLTVKTESGGSLSTIQLMEEIAQLQYMFDMPDSNVTITADIVEVPSGDFVRVNGGTVTGPINKSSVFIDKRTLTIPTMEVCSHEVTVGEFSKYCSDVRYDDYAIDDMNQRAAFDISWNDAILYCNMRSIAENLTPVYSYDGETDPNNWPGIQDKNGLLPPSDAETWKAMKYDTTANGYRLPTSAEWEYIAREGNNGKFPTVQTKYSGYDNIELVAWYKNSEKDPNAKFMTIPYVVGQKKPNELGVYDMCGNVSEWVWDVAVEPLPNTPITGATNIITSRYKRGGNYFSDAKECSLEYKSDISYYTQSVGNGRDGFRVVRTVFD